MKQYFHSEGFFYNQTTEHPEAMFVCYNVINVINEPATVRQAVIFEENDILMIFMAKYSL